MTLPILSNSSDAGILCIRHNRPAIRREDGFDLCMNCIDEDNAFRTSRSNDASPNRCTNGCKCYDPNEYDLADNEIEKGF